MKKIAIIVTSLAPFLIASSLSTASKAERGNQFYEFDDINTSKSKKENKTSNNKSDNKEGTIKAILEELLEVAKEQRDIQKDIFDLLSEEINPTPQIVTINGKECIANSSRDCFVMPLTNAAKRIPVLKALLQKPSVETAKNYLQWQAKYFKTGPFKVGRSFQYAMNTYGEEAYPMNITRPAVDSNTGDLGKRKETHRQTLLNKKYNDKTLALYIFLGNESLDYFSIPQLSKILKEIKNKKSVRLVFKTQLIKDNFLESSKSIENEFVKDEFSKVELLVNKEVFNKNNIYMTPTYMAISLETSKKQAVAIGRVGKDELNAKIYEWLEQEEIVKKGGLSDYKVWNTKEEKE